MCIILKKEKNNRIFRILFLLFLFSYSFSILHCTTHKIPLYFCTAANARYYKRLLNLIGSIHHTNFDETADIAVFDLGLSTEQLNHISTIKKISLHQVEHTHPNLLKDFVVNSQGKKAPGWYAWKPVVIKQSLELFPYLLFLDAGTTVLQPLTPLFRHIIEHEYFFTDCGHDINSMTTTLVKKAFHLESPRRSHILSPRTYGLNAGIIGITQALYIDFIYPLYNLSRDLRYYCDDGSAPKGFGFARYEQTLMSIYARLLGLKIFKKDWGDGTEIPISYNGTRSYIHITEIEQYRKPHTAIWHSRTDILHGHNSYEKYIRYKK